MAFELPEGVDLTKVPMGMNPSGADPNFDNPPTLAALSYGVIITMMSLAYFVVGLRVLSAIKKDRRLKVDDYCCILALGCTSAYGIIIMLMNKTARHAWDTPISFINETWFKRNAALCLLYGPAMFFSKVAICTLYLRIFNTVHWMRWTCWIAIALFTCVYWSMVPVYAIYSFPYGDETWSLPLVAKIGKADRMAIFTGTWNVASDLFLLAIPIPIILKLNLSMRKRIGLAAVFLTGIVGTVATALGLYFRVSLWLSKQDLDGGDASWVAAATYITVLVELFVTIMVSCVPGVVSSWRNVLRETTVVTSLRSMLNNSRYSFKGSRNSTQMSKEKAASIQSSEADLNPAPHDDTLATYGGFEEYQPAPAKTHESWGPITKTVKIQQSEV